MLQITKKQLELLSERLMASFIKGAILHLRQKFPKTTRFFPDNELSTLISEGIDKATGYNILESEEVLPFLEYLIVLGRNFDTDPENSWALEVLNDDDMVGADKISLLISVKPLLAE
jgi:hypothetical protein